MQLIYRRPSTCEILLPGAGGSCDVNTCRTKQAVTGAAPEAHATNLRRQNGSEGLGKLRSVRLELSFEGLAENALQGE